MTVKKAVALHELVSGEPAINYSSSEQCDIHREIEAIVAASSDRSAARIVSWWGCWDRKYTATAFCRRVREEYRNRMNMGTETHAEKGGDIKHRNTAAASGSAGENPAFPAK